jgi:hypothetical protein
MSNAIPFPTFAPRNADASTNAREESIIATIRVLVSELPPEAQERVLTEIKEMIRPISSPRAGEVLGTIVRLLRKGDDWTVHNLKQAVSERGVEASSKEIYNALGYLTRKKKIQRIGYGRYVVDGVEVVTADDLGGPPSRHEIDDT